jgi:putative peptidoglycan binding protein
MLTSELLSPSADLQNVAQGGRTIRAPETSDSVALIQEALIAIDSSLPQAGVDENFGAETGAAVSTFKQSRGLSPADPVVGKGTINRLDFELNYLEGTVTDQHIADTRLLARDPFLAGLVELQRPGFDLTSTLTDFFQFGNRLCFRLSFVLGAEVAAMIGRIAEPVVFGDYCTPAKQGPCTSADFFDRTPSAQPYVDFLLVQHPTLDPVSIGGLGSKKRPDILRHRGPTASEWYEIKPLSISGAIAARIKLHEITKNYTQVGLPYLPGNRYTPTEHVTLTEFTTIAGENLRLVLHLERRARGIVYWELCVEGDYVAYFNRVRLAAGILALVVAMAEILLPAAEAAGVVATIKAIALELGVAVPVLLEQ